MPEYKDQLGNTITLSSAPKRIVSLVPSQTELLFDLGLDEEIVGITKYCIHPKDRLAIRGIGEIQGIWKNTSTKLDVVRATAIPPITHTSPMPLAIIGGTKKLNLSRIRELKPDLIIGNKEENEKGQIEELQKEFPVWMSDIKIFAHAQEMILKLGLLLGKIEKAEEIKSEIQKRFITFSLYLPPSAIRSVLYLIWRKPYIAAGPDTFISHMMKLSGLKNSVPDGPSRYPELTPEEIKRSNPTHILLSSEPYPFRDKHIAELQSLCPNAKVVLADGEMFSWYGSRLLHAPDYFKELLGKL